MPWVAKRGFAGVVSGAEKEFSEGDPITDSEAKEMGLTKKPDLAKKVKNGA